MSRSFKQVFGPVVAFLVIAPLAIVLSPLIALVWSLYMAKQVWLIGQLRAAWAPNKVVLLAYTQSENWAPFIENSLLPQLGESVVAIDRSNEFWKRQNPVEAKAISFWGGHRSYNPIAIVIRNRWRVRVFRLYEAFNQFKHGNSRELDESVSKLLGCIKEVRHASA